MKRNRLHLYVILLAGLQIALGGLTPSFSRPQDKSEKSIASEFQADPSSEPHESRSTDGWKYVQAFMEKFHDDTKRFAVYYTLHPEYVSTIEKAMPATTALRFYNAMDDPTDPDTKYFLVCPMYKSEDNVEIIAKADKYWQADIENDNIVDRCKTGSSLPKGSLEVGTIDDLRAHVHNYDAAIRSKGMDNMKSFVVSLRDYHALVTGKAVSLRVYHGWDAEQSQRVIILVGVDANGVSLWSKGSKYCDSSHLCPQICDAL